MTYTEACKEATTRQGLDPMVARLTEAGVRHAVEQTGGMTMVLTVPVPDGTFGITEDEPGWLLCWYEGRDWEFSDEETDAWYGLTTDEVVARLLGEL